MEHGLGGTRGGIPAVPGQHLTQPRGRTHGQELSAPQLADQHRDDIEIERLLALPFTRLCLDCKSKQERQKKLKLYTEQEEA